MVFTLALNFKIKPQQKLGKYRVGRKLAVGGFASVYQAHDSIEGIPVALKIPHPQYIDDRSLHSFRKEVRLTAQLDHPNILPVKNASFIDGHFVIVHPLGERTLAHRLHRRMSTKLILDYSEQLLQALAHAHRTQIIHCDIKPENVILFPKNRVRLADFGIARFAQNTLSLGLGLGTFGYMAPEQAMGRASFRSDVFSMGLLIYRMLSGHLPEWPFRWPFPGRKRLGSKVNLAFIDWLRKSLELDQQKRYANCDVMLRAFQRVKRTAIKK